MLLYLCRADVANLSWQVYIRVTLKYLLMFQSVDAFIRSFLTLLIVLPLGFSLIDKHFRQLHLV